MRNLITDEAMMARLLPKDPELETEDEAYHTWHVKDWRSMKQRDHGPTFQCGGFPWWVDYLAHMLEKVS